MLILYIAIIAIIVTFGFVLFAVYRNFDPEDKPMAGSLTSGFLAVIVAVIAWYFVQQQIRGFELANISFENGKKAIVWVSGVSGPIVGYVEQACKCRVIHTEIA